MVRGARANQRGRTLENAINDLLSEEYEQVSPARFFALQSLRQPVFAEQCPIGRDMAYPTNVLHMATECSHKGHPATFPRDLPRWFIRLFTDEGDTVLDPFAGSGTTLVAALELGRKAIGIDTKKEYCQAVQDAIRDFGI